MSSEAQEPLPADVAISVRNLTKTYRLFDHPGDRVKQFLSFGLKRYHRQFTALKDISFDIKKGETVGIIGRNGSGKSTLLQLIAGILKPSSGNITVNGKISALLELGAGFNPEFTGRENIYFQGALSGLNKQGIDSIFSDIESFAEIGDFIDQPVRTYSSGMYVRLAFSAMIYTNSDILIIDEALGVGDEEFQRKSVNYLMNLCKQKKVTLLFVSHNIRQIEALCSKVLLLNKGNITYDGLSNIGCLHYRDSLRKIPETTFNTEKSAISRVVNITTQPVPDSAQFTCNNLSILVCISPEITSSVDEIALTIYTENSLPLGSLSTHSTSDGHSFASGDNQLLFQLISPSLLPGIYRIGLAARDRYQCLIYENENAGTFSISSNAEQYSKYLPRGYVNFTFTISKPPTKETLHK